MGPSKYQLCESQEETMEHLLNTYIFTSTLWDGISLIFRQTDRDLGNITSTLKKWRRNFSDNETLNKAWVLVPGFLIWDVWKERNNRIFKNRKGSSMAHILRQLNETVGTLIKNPPEDQPKDTDVQIYYIWVFRGLSHKAKT